jgi:hypothetical protein
VKYVVIFKPDGQNEWEHVGAFDVPEDVSHHDAPAVAVEQLARRDGVAVAIPFDDWVMYRVESRVTVERVPRKDEVEQQQDEEGGETWKGDPDMIGMKRLGE